MKRKFGIAAALMAGSLVLMNAAHADDTLFGALLGGGAGVLVGQAVGGRDGAIVGGALGAVAGAVIAGNDDDRRGGHAGYGRGYSRGYVAQPQVAEYVPQTVVVSRPLHDGPRFGDGERRYERDHDRHWDRGWDRHGDHGWDRHADRGWDRHGDRGGERESNWGQRWNHDGERTAWNRH